MILGRPVVGGDGAPAAFPGRKKRSGEDGSPDGWGDEPGPALRLVGPPAVSERAQARGLYTVESLKRAVLRQRATWWQGSEFHCPLCDVDFGTAQRAAEHVVREQHPVLRMD